MNDQKQQRTHRITVLLNDEERADIEAQARRDGLKLGPSIRSAALKAARSPS